MAKKSWGSLREVIWAERWEEADTSALGYGCVKAEGLILVPVAAQTSAGVMRDIWAESTDPAWEDVHAS